MKKEEYQKLLDEHEWYYMFTDDPNAWDRGDRNEKYLKSFFSDKILEEMYKTHETKIFNFKQILP